MGHLEPNPGGNLGQVIQMAQDAFAFQEQDPAQRERGSPRVSGQRFNRERPIRLM